MSTTQDILKLVRSKPKGTIFVPKDFLNFGSRDAIDKSLSRLVQQKDIRRIYRGIYDRPVKHSLLGALTPDPEKVVSAIARQNGYTLQVSGARATNDLGLSLQVPAKLVYYTDGPSRTICYNNIEISLWHTSPRRLIGAGTIHGAVIQALHHYGPDRITSKHIQHLSKQLSDKHKKSLLNVSATQPAWIHKAVQKISA